MRIAIGITLLILSLSLTAWAQPAIGTVSTYATATLQTSHTTGSVTPSGTNRALWICITNENAALDKTVTSVNFNTSESFTLLGSIVTEDPINTSWHVSVWYLPNPTATTATITYVHADAVTSQATIIPLSNAQQGIPTLENEDNTTTVTVSADLTTTVPNTLLLTCAVTNLSGQTHTHGAGQNEESDFSGASDTHSTSSEVKVTPGLETLTTTATSSTASYYVVTGIEPFVAPAASGRRRQAARGFQ